MTSCRINAVVSFIILELPGIFVFRKNRPGKGVLFVNAGQTVDPVIALVFLSIAELIDPETKMYFFNYYVS